MTPTRSLNSRTPIPKRKALLIQTDMDVDTDGSDPERWNEVDATDPTFQPLTNYKWIKRDADRGQPAREDCNQDRIDKLEAEAKMHQTPAKTSRQSIQTLRDDLYGVGTLQFSHRAQPIRTWSYRRSWRAEGRGASVHRWVIIVVVVAGNQLYPAIFGDKGPNHLLGEASIRMAQAVDPRASAIRSPVDDLKITYLVFPGTVEQPFGPPDLAHVRQRCQELLNEIGGNKADLHEWTSLLPPPPATPTANANAIRIADARRGVPHAHNRPFRFRPAPTKSPHPRRRRRPRPQNPDRSGGSPHRRMAFRNVWIGTDRRANERRLGRKIRRTARRVVPAPAVTRTQTGFPCFHSGEICLNGCDVPF